MSFPLFIKRSRIIFREKRQAVYHIIFLSVWIFTIYTGAIGMDFSHWDENKLFRSIRDSIPVGRVIPGWYNYPSMTYDLTVLSISPEILTTYLSDRSSFQEIMEKGLWGRESNMVFRPRARMLFLGITSLSLLWIYLLVYAWTKQWLPALLSSAVLASSWEFAYHARWIAPDAILMQFGVLVLLLVFLAFGTSGRRKFMWLIAAAVAAGMACGTKYFGGIFLVPVFMGGYKVLRDKDAGWGRTIAWFIVLVAVFTLTFLLITPGALIETERMILDVRYEISHYRTGDMGYTVGAGWEHFSLLLVYLFGVFFSKHIWISFLFSGFFLFGLYSLLKENWKAIETWIFLSIPLLFIPYMSQQRVMIVRNDLLLFPFLAVLCARGIMVVLKSRFIQASNLAGTLVAVGLVSALLVNYSWLYYAAESIPASAKTNRPQALRKYLSTHQEITFYLSTGARSLVNRYEFPNVVSDPYLADKLVFVFREVNFPLANRPKVYNPVFGPYEVNFDYYPSWNEDGRIVVMPMKAALSQSQFKFIYE